MARLRFLLQPLDKAARPFLLLEESFEVEGLAQFLELLVADADKARAAKEREKHTLALANNDRHLEAEAFWKPFLEEFRQLCEDGMKPDTARSKILNKWTERDDAPSMKTARKWLRPDDEAG